MKKRTFLAMASGLATLFPFLSSFRLFALQEKLKNWAGNLVYSTNNVFYPESVEEVQRLVKKLPYAKALGSRHCFNDIADSKHNLVSMEKLNKVVVLDAKAKLVTIEGGMNYGKLSPYLDQRGFGLHNLASLPHISVAGACATATHGSGVKNGNLATSVKGLEVVMADGSLVNFSSVKDGEKFNGIVVGLGALGIITKVTLALQPAYKVRQVVYEEMPLDQLQNNFDRIVSAGYSVSLFTDWQKESFNEVWIKSLANDPAIALLGSEFFGGKAATKNVHPIMELSAENCTEQLGVPGAWYDRLPHFKMGFTPSSGKELQAEYFVSRSNAVDAILAIQRMGKEIGPYLFISEVRTVAEDNFWLSPSYKQDCVAIHFTWKQEWNAVIKLLPKIEKELAPFNVRPHWGKLFTIDSSTLAARYPKMDEFRKLAREFDPRGKFRNDFLNKTVFG
jgi:alditol oxidase